MSQMINLYEGGYKNYERIKHIEKIRYRTNF